jgi:hypothetical protein
MMHLVTFLFTTMCTHITVVDDGVGEEPPNDDWGVGAAVKNHWGVPVQPVARALVVNADSSTMAVRLNPDGSKEPEFFAVIPIDEKSGKCIFFGREGGDKHDPLV